MLSSYLLDTTLDVDDPRAKQTDGELEAWVIDDAPVSDEPVLIQSVNWTLETDEQELDLTIAIDTTGFTDGWHRLQLAGIITGDESFTRMVLLEASFASSNGNPVGSDVPRGPRASGLLADASAHTVGIVDIEILSEIPAQLPSLWHPNLRSWGTLSDGGTDYNGGSLFLSFDGRPGAVEHADLEVNEWPLPSTDFILSIHPPDGESWLYARSTLVTASHSLAAALVVATDAATVEPAAPSAETDESDDTDPSAAPPPAPLIPGAWFVATGGNGNGSPIAPFGTIQEGLVAADAGHVIIVGPGAYHENLTTRRNGTPSKQILLVARDGLGSVQIVDATNDTVLDVAHAYLVVSGFIFDGNLSPQHTVVIRDGGDYLFFSDNEVGRSGKDCIHMAGPEGVRVERTVPHDCQPS